jgi:hypothetical protein
MKLTTRSTPVPTIISASKYSESGSQGFTELQIRNPCSLDPQHCGKKVKEIEKFSYFSLVTLQVDKTVTRLYIRYDVDLMYG